MEEATLQNKQAAAGTGRANKEMPVTQRADHGDETRRLKLRICDPDVTERVSDPDATVRVRPDKSLHHHMSQLYTRAVSISREQAREAQAVTHPLPSPAQTAVPGQRVRERSTGLLSITSVICLMLIGVLLLSMVWQRVLDPRYVNVSQQQRAQVEQQFVYARAIGVSMTDLAPLLKQEQQIDRGLPWFSPSFYLQPGPAYSTQAGQYRALQQRIPGVIIAATQRAQAQARQAMQQFQITLGRISIQPIGNTAAFARRFSTDQLQLTVARHPAEYLALSQDAQASTTALHTMEGITQQLDATQSLLTALQSAHLPVQQPQRQYQQDIQAFASASDPGTVQTLHVHIEKHYQTLLTMALQNYTVVSKARLESYAQDITTLKHYGKDITAYQASLRVDTAQAGRARTSQDKLAALQRIDQDDAVLQDALSNAMAHAAVIQIHQEVASWAKAHPYHDSFDGKDYAPDVAYMSQGIGSTLDADLASAVTGSDYQAVLTEVQNARFNLHLLEADSRDTTPYNRVHATDMQALTHYQLTNKLVLVISLVGQSMRLYQQGRLQRAFQVVTGSPQRPSLPGVWLVLDRKSPTTFVSKDPKGSPFWFPPTPISYAILYHYGGDYLHDASWRSTFGAGAQYPHQDSNGNTPYNYDGSHGCINLTVSDMAWVYTHTNWQTTIVIY